MVMKWTTLKHNGLIFPNEYQRHNIPVLINNQETLLSPEQEEAITFYVKLNKKYKENETLKKNFWEDWSKLLGKNHKIKSLNQCDLSLIENHVIKQRQKKLDLTKEEKERIKTIKLENEEPYKYCYIDGKKEKVDNYKIEPPGIFIGRGCHPMIGKIKKRIMPIDVTINIDKDSSIPTTPYGRYGNIIHNNNVTWIASWNDPISGIKYVYLSQESSIRGSNDKKKFETARMLRKKITKIRNINNQNLSSNNEKLQQLATCCYFIDKLALRAGNEKGKDEADTVGVCSLRLEHIKLLPNNKIKLDFLGKDSIRYVNHFKVDTIVYDNLIKFINKHSNDRKKKKQMLFDLVNTRILNNYLQQFMKCLTSKVFRTYNASYLLEKELNKINPDLKMTSNGVKNLSENVRIENLMLHYNHANAKVAILCNHQKTVSDNYGKNIDKIKEQIKKLTKQRNEIKSELDAVESDSWYELKKKKKLKKKKSSKPSQYKEKIKKLMQKIKKLKLREKSKNELKNVSLSTSKVNYIDPRIIVAFMKKFNIPMEKIFSTKLQSKFSWAMDVDENYKF